MKKLILHRIFRETETRHFPFLKWILLIFCVNFPWNDFSSWQRFFVKLTEDYTIWKLSQFHFCNMFNKYSVKSTTSHITCWCAHVDFTEFYSYESFSFLEKFREFKYTVWKLRKFSLTHFWQKFRESNGFAK